MIVLLTFTAANLQETAVTVKKNPRTMCMSKGYDLIVTEVSKYSSNIGV